ncbi:response regulator transcription factor [Anaerolineales bacterium HSG6]|nr:response regulator transcription factor [Anaerolineales bacterium HSG6]MDM8532451.1 response regulator transcription factor [Anaerolineales bacterium HSG25]
MIRIVLVDDQIIVREGLAAIIGTDPEIEVVGQADNGEDALAQVRALAPDLVVMDLQMPVMNGVQATQSLNESHPSLPVLVLTTYAADEWVFDAIRAGAAGYLLKDSRRDELVAAIKGTMVGESFLDPAIAGKLMKYFNQKKIALPTETDLADLTNRERDVLRLIGEGLNNSAIAERLHLAPGTVRNYVSTIIEKLDVADRTQAAVIAMKAGLVRKG